MRAPLLLVLALAAAAPACGRSSSPRVAELSVADAGRALVDRNWIDVMPKNRTDRLHVYRFTPSMGGGVYQDRTIFKGEFELFVFRTEGRQLTFLMPETEEKVKTGYRIERVSGPEPFDLKLTFERTPRGPRVFYGMTHDGHDLDAWLASLGTTQP